MDLIPLWHNCACQSASEKIVRSPKAGVTIKDILPSGRQAISAVLAELGLSRSDRVAVPEWSSHCVLSAVSRVATPIPLGEVLEHGLHVSCVLVYEHWGWSFSIEKLNRFLDGINVQGVVIDRVDTASLEPVAVRQDCFEVWSLSKVLGLKMGGLAKTTAGSWVSCDSTDEFIEQDREALSKSWCEGSLNNTAYWLKTYSKGLCESVVRMIAGLDLEEAFRVEGRERRRRAAFLSDKLGHDDLALRLENGGAPGIYPCGLNHNRKELLALQSVMEREGVETRIYNFNFSDDPGRPRYVECLALPIHSGVSMEKIESIIKFLIQK